MGAWGQGAFQNDDNLDWLGDLNQSMRVGRRIEKDIKQKKYPLTTRGAVEYMIRSNKAWIFPIDEFQRLAPIAVRRLRYVRGEVDDPNYWKMYGDEKLSKQDLKSINNSIKAVQRDIDRQINYLEAQIAEFKEQDDLPPSISKSELEKAYAKLKKGTKKAGRKAKKDLEKAGREVGSLADSSARGLADAYAALKKKEAKRQAKKKAKKRTKKKASKKKAKKRTKKRTKKTRKR